MVVDMLDDMFVEALVYELGHKLSIWRELMAACLEENPDATDDWDLRGAPFVRQSLALRFWDQDSLRRCRTTAKQDSYGPVSYTHLRAHETPEHLVCRLLLEKKKHIS
eukprot:TRINITY_DN12321_c0_g1_i1.p1 TRINITY_DN12321_c0_g1~~TRINITY_DN12321_c0_g1_i1.p1  ORF type:complete len:108 (+),score=26.26 TRINITY_DN12321_c0_g1_i1:149-472(+)